MRPLAALVARAPTTSLSLGYAMRDGATLAPASHHCGASPDDGPLAWNAQCGAALLLHPLVIIVARAPTTSFSMECAMRGGATWNAQCGAALFLRPLAMIAARALRCSCAAFDNRQYLVRFVGRLCEGLGPRAAIEHTGLVRVWIL